MKNIQLELDAQQKVLSVKTAGGLKKDFAFPAAAVSINGRRIEAETLCGNIEYDNNGGFSAVYEDSGITFRITVTPAAPEWFFKTVELETAEELPTPDYVDADHQTVYAPGLERCGFMMTVGDPPPVTAEEESNGYTPGCGYPLVGKDMFTGVEHPAAFNSILSQDGEVFSWHLRQHPVWENKRIRCTRAVTGLSADPHKCFWKYVDTFRIPPRENFMFSFCSFWSDPYLGNYEYKVDRDNYTSFVRAFSAMGLRPDVYTLDAGWQNRRSFYDAKEDFGGNDSLKKLADEFRANGADLSLWISLNGPMGMEKEFLNSHGIAAGGGPGSGYRGKDFAVLMDKKLEKKLTERFCELCGPEYRTVHYKVDWDNECSTSPEFTEIYPTVNHVREASTDTKMRIFSAIREKAPGVAIRAGYNPSPWWLKVSTHVFLWGSGDSEFTCFPSLSQRDAAQTHRDACYYIMLGRDKSFLPLDTIDNHEFPHAMRNPFIERPDEWCNTCLWTVMRGTSYVTLKLQPEALEEYQADTLRQTLEYARKNAKAFLTGKSFMFGDSPARGAVYGFCHPGEDGKSILALRNASPVPQKYTLPEYSQCYTQTYPVYQNFKAGDSIWMLPHEVKVFAGSSQQEKLPLPEFRLIDGKVFAPSYLRPGVAETYQIPHLEQTLFKIHDLENATGIETGICVPYRMRDFKLTCRIKKRTAQQISGIRLSCSRYDGWNAPSRWQVPFSELFFNNPGHGEVRNPDVCTAPGDRYFTAELPQGGNFTLNLKLEGTGIDPEDIDLFVSGFEAPAKTAEPDTFTVPETLEMPFAHPYGFPRVIELR